MKCVHVVAGVIVQGGEILLTRRAPGESHAGLWEFPGGKVEGDEAPREALRRELREALGLAGVGGDFVAGNRHRYPGIEIQLDAYWVAGGGQPLRLKVHDEAHWVQPDHLLTYKLAPADVPIAEHLKANPLPSFFIEQ